MKVVFIIGIFPKISETWLTEQILALLELGLDLDIISFHRGTDVTEEIRTHKLLEHTTYIDVPPDRARRVTLGIFNCLRILLISPKILIRLFRVARSFGDTLANMIKFSFWVTPLIGKMQAYDVVHCHFGMTANKYMIIRDILDLHQPFVTTFYGIDSNKYIVEKGPGVYDRLKRDCAMTLTMTNEMTERFTRLGFPANRLRVNYHGVVSSKYDHATRSYIRGEKLHLVFVGRFTDKKGIPDMLQAIQLVVQKNKNILLHVFGGGNEQELNKEISEVISKYKLEPYVHLYGMRPNKEMLKALLSKHFMVQLSKTAKNGDTDDLPFVLLEAGITGLPAITTHHVGIPDAILDGETGFLVPEGDPNSAAEKILYVLDHPEVVEKMSVAVRKFVLQNFDLREISKNQIRLYESLISSS